MKCQNVEGKLVACSIHGRSKAFPLTSNWRLRYAVELWKGRSLHLTPPAPGLGEGGEAQQRGFSEG